MSYVLGLDASTQSISATLVDSSMCTVVDEISVNFGTDLPKYNAPSGFIPDGEEGEVHSDPLMWLDALDLLCAKMVDAEWSLSEIVAISGSGQQHGSVYLNADFEENLRSLSVDTSLADQIRSALSRSSSPIWMDSSTKEECEEIAASVGGNEKVCELSGSVAIERFTGPQIRKFFKSEPKAYQETSVIHLVSSFFASVLAGKNAPVDTGDGAGMNLMNLSGHHWELALLDATAPDLFAKLPTIASSIEKIGGISLYFVEKYGFSPSAQIYTWSGDNPCSLVGIGASSPGNMVISLGTSYTLFAGMDKPHTDPNGYGHVFGNPMGGYMSLLCFKNGSLAREQISKTRDVDWSNFGADYLEQTPVGNEGKLMLPFYEPEITPCVQTTAPITNGWSLMEEDVSVEIRACLEGQFLNMRIHSQFLGSIPKKILLTGGGSKSPQICQVVADVFGTEVVIMRQSASASLGAAIMAGVAHGEASLAAFESALYLLDEGSVIHPDEIAHQTYNKFLPEFKNLYRAI